MRALFVSMIAITMMAMGGCAEARYYQAAIHEAAAEAKNLEAETLAAAPCLIGLGAFFRIDDMDVRRGLVLLCGSGQEIPGAELTEPAAIP